MRSVPVALLRTLLAAGIFLAGFSLHAQEDAALRRARIEAIYPVMIAALEAKQYSRARNICEQAILWEPLNPVHHYNLACIEAQAGGARMPRALTALELAVALGFDDAEHMQTDPDLAPVRDDPKFAELVRKAAARAAVDAAIDGLKIPERPAVTPAPTPAAAASETAAATFRDGVPVGLYFMTKYWPLTRTLEKTVWYFAENGGVYKDVQAGISPADLKAHSGPRGQSSLNGSTFEVTWADGQKSAASLEREGSGFTWDMGIFTAVAPFAGPDEIAGVFQSEERLGAATHRPPTLTTLELRTDGTYRQRNDSVSPAGSLASGSAETTGQWRLNGWTLTLTSAKGEVTSGIAFPLPEKAGGPADQMVFRGTLFKRQR